MDQEVASCLYDRTHFSGRTSLLALFPIFSALSEPARAALSSKLIERQMSDGETLFIKGQPETFMALIVSGKVHTVLSGPNGRELIVGTFGTGELVGESAMLNPRGRPTSAICVGKTRLWILSQRHFSICSDEPAFMHKAWQLMCERNRHTLQLFESIALYKLESRLARFLLSKLEEAGCDMENGVAIPIPRNQGHLAAMINASRPKLNAQLQHWRRSGMICLQQDRLSILDVERMRSCATADC